MYSPTAIDLRKRLRKTNNSSKRSACLRLLCVKIFHRPRASMIFMTLSLTLAAFLVQACGVGQKQSGIPPEAQATIDTFSEDIDAGRYEKIYQEAAEEWRQSSTLEQSEATFNTLKTKLGSVKSRVKQTASEEQTNSGSLPGHSLNITCYTTFERGDGMETFTLIEREGHWQLARYFVNSNALK